ncbi:hypothetical protein BH23GEM10_BH23GEM10_16580 [soil metagenome]
MSPELSRTLTCLLAIVLLSVATTPGPVSGQAATDAAAAPAPADAYRDEGAREIVRLARERRAMFDSRIQAYSTTAVERISVGLRAGFAERLLYRRETASRIDWTLDTVRIEVLGARNVVPPFSGMPRVPADLDSYMPSLAFDPVDSEMMLRLDSTNLRHPLAAGSEAHYRFESGDSTLISLPDGRSVRLLELRILPRRQDPELIAGSFWVDAASHAVVQAYFRQSRPFDADQDDDDDCGIACRMAIAVVRPVRMELEYIAIDYGLWDLHWWLPRSIAARGVLQAGRFTVPVQFERRYDDYTVLGDTVGRVAVLDSLQARPCRPRVAFSIVVDTSEPDSAQVARRDSIRTARRDSITAARRAEREAAGDATAADTAAACDRAFIVTTVDRDELLTSDMLPTHIYVRESGVLSASDLEVIAEGLRRIPVPAWQLEKPVLYLPADFRYNRVEGLSASVGARLAFGQLAADAELGIGTGDQRPRGEVGVTRAGRATQSRAGAYVRLVSLEPAARPFSLGSSLNAALFGRDSHDYFRTAGAEVTLRPAETHVQWYDLRLFAERQRSAVPTTDFSLARLIDGDMMFRPNSPADAAAQVGATLVLRIGRGLDPRAFRWATELELHGETGDYTFTRPALRLHMSQPLGRIELATELAGGSSFGTAPAQRDWLLGGVTTLRGYPAATLRGEAFWRARAEFSYGMPFARLSVFGDVGFAGPRADLRTARPLRSAGVGLTFLDGLLRIDLAHAIDSGAWRVHGGIR